MKFIATRYTYDEPLGQRSYSIEFATEQNRNYDEDAAESEILYEVEAVTWEEAMAIHHLRMGWEPYKPGKACQCPECGSTYYEGSGWCWKCPYGHPKV